MILNLDLGKLLHMDNTKSEDLKVFQLEIQDWLHLYIAFSPYNKQNN